MKQRKEICQTGLDRLIFCDLDDMRDVVQRVLNLGYAEAIREWSGLELVFSSPSWLSQVAGELDLTITKPTKGETAP